MASGVFRLFYGVLVLLILLTVAVVAAQGPIISYFDKMKERSDSEHIPLEKLVAVDDIELRTIVSSLTSACAEGDAECYTYAVYRYVSGLSDEKLPTYSGAPEEYRRPLYFSSLLANAGIPSKLALGDGKALNAVCGLSEKKLFGIVSEDIRGSVVLKDSVRLAAGKVWFAAPELPENGMAVDIDILSSDNVSLYVFSSINRMDPADMVSYFPECSERTGKQIQERCFLRRGNVIAVYAGALRAAYTINVTGVPFMQDDILTASYGGEHCIVLDTVAGGTPLGSVPVDGSEKIIDIEL